MAYAVVHGSDQTLTPCRTATECLEFVKLLEAQSEPIIRIHDKAGASMKLATLEKLHRQEVERKNLIGDDVFSSAPPRKPQRVGRYLVWEPLIAAFLALIMLGLTIEAVSRRQEAHREQKKGQERHAAPTSPKGPQTAGQTAVPNRSAKISSEATMSYRIETGDTLAGIARKTLHDPGRWRDIAKANPGLDPHHLRPGLVIILPSSTRTATSPRERVIRGQVPHVSPQPRS